MPGGRKKQSVNLAKANEQLKTRTLQQGVVAHLGNVALTHGDLKEVFDEAVVLVAQTLKVENAKVLELLPDGNSLLLRAGVGWKEGLVGHATIKARGSQAGYTLLAYEPVVVKDLRKESRFSSPPLLRAYGIVSGMSAVIHGKDRPYGILGAHTRKRRAFTGDDVNFLQSIANLLSTAIQRKDAEEALRQSEEKYRQLFEESRDPIYITTREGNFVELNQAALELFGYSREELIGLKANRLYLHPADRHRFRRKIEQQSSVRDFEVQLKRKDAKVMYCLLTSSLRRDEEGKIVGYQGIIRDITERKQAEAELENSRAQLRAFAAHLQAAREEERTRVAREIHDELGQELTGLKMDLSWLGKKLPKDQRLLSEKTGSMIGLVDKTIQTVRRISTELRPGVLDDLGLEAALEWQVQEFQNRTGIQCALASLVEDAQLDLPRSTALFRIFQETLTNVARHARATRVRIKLAQENGRVTLEVKDNGEGIRKSRLSDPKSLGLLGMRERALLLGGEVTITGKRGKGTTVTARIPVEAA